jgi:DUF4097 and DUF4098 domain-containing protein YvlB
MPLALLLLLAAPQRWSFDVGEAPLVKVSNVTGSIRVEGIQARGVGITAEASGGSDEEQARWNVEVRGSQTQVTVRVCCGRCGSDGKSCHDSVRFDLTLKVPDDARLELEGVSTRVSVAGVRGEQRVATASGDVEVEGSAGRVTVGTVSGKISLRQSVAAAGRIHSVSGDISLALPAPARVSFSTVSGRLNGESGARSLGKSGPKIAVETVSGNLTVVDSARPSR